MTNKKEEKEDNFHKSGDKTKQEGEHNYIQLYAYTKYIYIYYMHSIMRYACICICALLFHPVS